VQSIWLSENRLTRQRSIVQVLCVQACSQPRKAVTYEAGSMVRAHIGGVDVKELPSLVSSSLPISLCCSA